MTKSIRIEYRAANGALLTERPTAVFTDYTAHRFDETGRRLDAEQFFTENGIYYHRRLNSDLTPASCTTLLRCSPAARGVVTVRPDVFEIELYAFDHCTQITKILLPQNQPLCLAAGAFADCSALQELALPAGTTYDYNVLLGCTALRRLTLADGGRDFDDGDPQFTGCDYVDGLLDQLPPQTLALLTVCAPAGSPAEQVAHRRGILFEAL